MDLEVIFVPARASIKAKPRLWPAAAPVWVGLVNTSVATPLAFVVLDELLNVPLSAFQATTTPGPTLLPKASVRVAVSVLVEVPLAMIVLGDVLTTMLVVGPGTNATAVVAEPTPDDACR
jgi:hypothetical protein